MNKDIVYEGDPTRTYLEIEKEEEMQDNQLKDIGAKNTELKGLLKVKEETEKWVGKPSVVDYEEMKQETQSTCQPNSVVHYLRAHKQMVHIISST